MADYTVTGTLNPDATGDYTQDGTYNGEPAYKREDGAYWIWFWGPSGSDDIWRISAEKGDETVFWYKNDPATGDYSPDGVTGTATVTAADGTVLGGAKCLGWTPVRELIDRVRSRARRTCEPLPCFPGEWPGE